MAKPKKIAPAHDARRYRITSGIPIPTPRFFPDRYPFKRMKVGQSFGFPADEEPRVRNAISSYREKAKSVTFTIRFEEDRKGRRNTNRRRIWRIT